MSTSVTGFFWASRNFFSQNKTCPSVEIEANWLSYAPVLGTKVEIFFFMSSSRPGGNHLMLLMGALWDATFLFTTSVTCCTEEGSWSTDVMTGEIYLILFFYDFLAFFLDERPMSRPLRSHIIICPLIVPAMMILGSLGLNSKVMISSGEVRTRRGSMACISS